MACVSMDMSFHNCGFNCFTHFKSLKGPDYFIGSGRHKLFDRIVFLEYSFLLRDLVSVLAFSCWIDVHEVTECSPSYEFFIRFLTADDVKQCTSVLYKLLRGATWAQRREPKSVPARREERKAKIYFSS